MDDVLTRKKIYNGVTSEVSNKNANFNDESNNITTVMRSPKMVLSKSRYGHDNYYEQIPPRFNPWREAQVESKFLRFLIGLMQCLWFAD